MYLQIHTAPPMHLLPSDAYSSTKSKPGGSWLVVTRGVLETDHKRMLSFVSDKLEIDKNINLFVLLS